MGNSITIINPRTGVGGTITTLPTARSSDTIIIAESSPILPLDGPFHGHGTPDAAKFDTGSAPQPAQSAPADGKGTQPPTKKFWTAAKIIGSILVGLATVIGALVAVDSWWQSHQSIKLPAEELSNPVLRNDGENSHD
ncbi:MAG: hypothetical protein MdMp014T_0740 [Treponematales bacterium]